MLLYYKKTILLFLRINKRDRSRRFIINILFASLESAILDTIIKTYVKNIINKDIRRDLLRKLIINDKSFYRLYILSEEIRKTKIEFI